MPVPRSCGRCQSNNLQPIGQGTERAESFLQSKFNYPIIRVDRDVLSEKESLKSLLETAQEGRPCILIGTQMLAKGHHFPNVTLAIVLDADGSLFNADFRSAERTAQLITQVSGRSGRGSTQGEAILQTRYPDHPLIQQLSSQKYLDTAKTLLQERQQLSLPPRTYMALFRAESTNARQAHGFLIELANQIHNKNVEIIGPLTAPIEMRRNRFRFQLFFKAPRRSDLHRQISVSIAQAEQLKPGRGLRWSIDIDPQNVD